MTFTDANADSASNFTNRKMVVFCGPHKSASSSVQELFMKHASRRAPIDQEGGKQKGNQYHHPSLINWTWPWNPRRRSYLPRKGFAPLVTEGRGFWELIWKTTQELWTLHDANLIWGTEELDRFGSVPWSGRDGLAAIRRMQNLTRPQGGPVELVVNYRRPRQGQWISIWKQLTRTQKDNQTYAGFLCNKQEADRIWEYLDCVANPLGLVQAFLEAPPTRNLPEYQTTITKGKGDSMDLPFRVHLLDMDGIAEKGKDVGHILACDVLGVPCTEDHWLPNIERPIVQNAKSGHPGLTESQLHDIEWALLQRDCTYQASLCSAQQQGQLVLHAPKDLWQSCPHTASPDLSRFANTTFLLNLLQAQVGCASDDTIGTIETWRQKFSEETAKVASSFAMQTKKKLIQGKELNLVTANARSFHEETTPLEQMMHAQFITLYVIFILLTGILLSRLRCVRNRECLRKQSFKGKH